MKNHSDELIFQSQGLRRSAANLEIASENSPPRNSPRVSSREALRHRGINEQRNQGIYDSHLYTAAYRQSIVRGEAAPDTSIDTSGFFMLGNCSAQVGGGSEISASASGDMAPALLTGAEEGQSIWNLTVTMKARKTDPPRSFRRFRRVMAVAGQVLGK